MVFSTKRFVSKVSTMGIPINKAIDCIQAERINPIGLIRDDVNLSPVDLLHFINHFADQSQTSCKRFIFVLQKIMLFDLMIYQGYHPSFGLKNLQ